MCGPSSPPYHLATTVATTRDIVTEPADVKRPGVYAPALQYSLAFVYAKIEVMILAFVYVLIMNKKRKEAQLAKEVCIIMNKISHWAFGDNISRSSEHYPKEHTVCKVTSVQQ